MSKRQRGTLYPMESARLRELKERGDAVLRDLREIADDMKRHVRSLDKIMIYGTPAVTLG